MNRLPSSGARLCPTVGFGRNRTGELVFAALDPW